jgi:hypothetical protein
MYRRILVSLGGLLALFHGWLLWSQLWSGQLAEPGLVLRWAVAGGLLAALVALRRSGVSAFWGRRAIAVWLLATLLHAPAAAGERIGHDSPALPEAVTALIEIAAASVIVGLGLVLLASIAGGLLARPLAAHRPALARVCGTVRLQRVLRFAPRPPPARSSFTRG